MTATSTFDVFCSLDGFGTAGGDWTGYWGKQGPELLDHRLELVETRTLQLERPLRRAVERQPELEDRARIAAGGAHAAEQRVEIEQPLAERAAGQREADPPVAAGEREVLDGSARRAWPTSAYATPTSASIGGVISPVSGPPSSQNTSWAARPIPVPARISRAASSDRKVGATNSSGCSASRLSSATAASQRRVCSTPKY